MLVPSGSHPGSPGSDGSCGSTTGSVLWCDAPLLLLLLLEMMNTDSGQVVVVVVVMVTSVGAEVGGGFIRFTFQP